MAAQRASSRAEIFDRGGLDGEVERAPRGIGEVLGDAIGLES
jgi:hypothetical protein